ncbi:Signal recognition particle receptor subunit alpha [Rhizoctonia solani]|uniref:Signal recognition particle receptor subunit alpha n=1 Tax=Rhizoctonia solani TaxID=456999 RepID=A0A0K6FXN1_9AGAM|nr:Signal recognition particle receptor subunit alpha [Rhizoctonia solani]
MLDHCSISHKGGAILWSRSFTPSASPVNSLVREAIIQDRAAPEDVFEKDGYAIKFKFVNDLELIFVVAYQRILQLTYVDDLLNVMRSVFVDMFAPFLKTFLAAVHAGTGAITHFDFKTAFAEWDATFDKILRTLQDKATQERKARLNKPTPRVVLPVTPPSDTAPALSPEAPGDAEEIARNVQALKSRLKGQGKGRARRAPAAAGSSVGGSDSDTSHTPRKKPAKTARRWADSALRPEDLAALDYSSAPSDVDNSRSIDISQLVDESSRGAVGADGLYEVKDLDWAAAKDEETEDLISRALNKSQEKEEASASSTAWSWLSRLTGGGKVLSAEDLAPVLNGMREHLMKKNVAKEIADKICESVGEGLVGKRVSGFASIKSETRNALSSAITRILTPKTSTDLLLSIRSQKSTQPTPQPYVITFVGVNGVGKSTSLGKVAFWLLQNNLRVLVAACDTFRSGAVEQLRVHVRNLGMLNDGGEKIELYEKGYGKDAAGIAKEAIAYAGQKGYDVVLVDTAGRMQDNEPLMKALAKLVAVNQPDKIVFVGEALVGNEAVDQLSKFDRALKDFSNGRGIDGMLVTKWDTVDDKVGAALSMTYVTGQPIIFVGCGQTYTDLRQLRVQHIVQALLSD